MHYCFEGFKEKPLATVPRIRWVLEKLCGEQSVVLEMPRAQKGPAVSVAHNQRAKLSPAMSLAPPTGKLQ